MSARYWGAQGRQKAIRFCLGHDKPDTEIEESAFILVRVHCVRKLQQCGRSCDDVATTSRYSLLIWLHHLAVGQMRCVVLRTRDLLPKLRALRCLFVVGILWLPLFLLSLVSALVWSWIFVGVSRFCVENAE